MPFAFDSSSPVYTASAPGRLDVMGGIADYSGALVLQLPIRETTTVSVRRRTDGWVRVRSEQVPEPFAIRYESLLIDGRVDYAAARARLAQHPGGTWAGYVVGCLLALHREKGIRVAGLEVHVTSEVPPGKGVSSSAALEVATLRALTEAYDLTWQGTELPRLAQVVENQIVGAPCGLMDQLACHFGQPGHLLPIHCQPDRVGQPLPLPAGIRFVGIDSGVRHAVGGASYGDVRAAAFAGYSLIAQQAGVSKESLAEARRSGDRTGLPFGGYLAALPVEEFERTYAAMLPERLRGSDFLAHFGTTIDAATTLHPAREYPVRAATSHPVREQARIEPFRERLLVLPQTPVRQTVLRELGELMYASHASYSACGLGHARTDELVELARLAGGGVYGAKITGGGSGGTVCLLCDGAEGLATARSIYRTYAERHGETYFLE
jgi:L-arabinokinase